MILGVENGYWPVVQDSLKSFLPLEGKLLDGLEVALFKLPQEEHFAEEDSVL